MFLPVAKALLGHYRRYPLQLVLVWLGLTLGVSIIMGVSTISTHVQNYYINSEKLFVTPLKYQIRATDNDRVLPYQLLTKLKSKGYPECVPVGSLLVESKNGTPVQLVGIEDLTQFAKPLYPSATYAVVQPVVSRDLAKRLALKEGGDLLLDNGLAIGPLHIDNENLLYGAKLVIHLSVLQRIRGDSNLALISCSDMSYQRLQALKSLLPGYAALSKMQLKEVTALNKTYHINLMAMGMLAFVVGLFIYYQAMSLSLLQRQPLVGVLRQSGVSTRELVRALSVELGALSFLSWVSGHVIGLAIASQIMPAFSHHDAQSWAQQLLTAWDWHWSAYSFLLTFLGAVSSCIWPLFRLVRSEPIRLTSRLAIVRSAGREFLLQALIAVLLLALALGIYQWDQAGYLGLVIAILLVAAALITPFILWKLFDILSYRLPSIRLRWLFADAAASMGYRGIATMGFMIALAANFSVLTVIGSVEQVTERWLNNHLGADLYIYTTKENRQEIGDWLVNQSDVNALSARWERDVVTEDGLVQVVGFSLREQENVSSMIKVAVPEYWDRLNETKVLLINESMATKRNLRSGDYIALNQPFYGVWMVAGVYYDYGNPHDQIMMLDENWHREVGNDGNLIFGATIGDSVKAQDVMRRLMSQFGLASDTVFQRNDLHMSALGSFERSFSIAQKLSIVTLTIAVFGIFFATLAGESARLKQLTLLRFLGISRTELIVLGGLQLLTFGVVALTIAVPLGVLIARLVLQHVVHDVIGWSVPLTTFPIAYLIVGLISILALVVSGAMPLAKLLKDTPIQTFRNSF